MKLAKLVVLVALTHVLVIGSVLCLQGCRTKPVGRVEPPPSPVLPPQPEEMLAPSQPLFQPPTPIEPAPAMLPPSGAHTYKVQRGDTLSKIAAKAGVSVRELVELNNIKDPNKIRVGQTLTLPDYATPLPAGARTRGESQTAPAKAAEVESVKVPAGEAVHIVVAGDSLSKIAKKYGVKISDLRAANNLSGDLIRVGQKLVIPGKEGATKTTAKETPSAFGPTVAPSLAPVSAAPPATTLDTPAERPAPPLKAPSAETAMAQPVTYLAQEQDTWESIARMFMVDVNKLMAVNNATDPNQLLPVGRKVLIPLKE